MRKIPYLFQAIVIGLALIGCNTSAQQVKVGEKWIPKKVDFDNPVYETDFDSKVVLDDWCMEGGLRMDVAGGNLILESERGVTESTSYANHLVCWLKHEAPADFYLEFTVKPENKKQGLNIIFFNARGINGESIFSENLSKRDGFFEQYHSGDLNNYHCSYWSGDRGYSGLRKNKGFHLLTTGEERITNRVPGEFQKVGVFKRGGLIRVMVDDIVIISYKDDGVTYGPIHDHSGWIGLRQMAHTVKCEYEYFKVYPLKN